MPIPPAGKGPRDSMAALADIIAPSDLSMVFQPICDMHTLEIFAYEALLRCRRPEFSPPPVLFERAMRDHCVGRLGRLIREVAVPLIENIPLFLNVHPKELEERWLVQPDDPMYFHDSTIFLEITESVPMTHFMLCRDVLRSIRSMGSVELVVDDLGAGYSNFGRIAELEPSVVKLDMGLIRGVENTKRTQTLITSLVRLCMDLGARVVAEGIETADSFLALRDCGVHLGQGYYLARPQFPLPSIAPEAVALRTTSSMPRLHR
ncbi:MAG: EAL domain-containing protein [Deltaproteobacteria bacterium]|nr:EAL domain-containing protein [Deltaproteobacteria bacterium]